MKLSWISFHIHPGVPHFYFLLRTDLPKSKEDFCWPLCDLTSLCFWYKHTTHSFTHVWHGFTCGRVGLNKCFKEEFDGLSSVNGQNALGHRPSNLCPKICQLRAEGMMHNSSPPFFVLGQITFFYDSPLLSRNLHVCQGKYNHTAQLSQM